MTNKEILEKAIQKAIDGGWLPYFHEFDEFLNKDTVVYQLFDTEQKYATVLFGAEAKGYVAYAGQYRLTISDLIFDHDFAKALWQGSDPEFWHLRGQLTGRGAHGSKQLLESAEGEPFIPAWQYHLQQMVIADDPIEYLGSHLDG